MAKILFVESDDVESNRVREKLSEHDLQLTATILENTDVTSPDLAIVSWDLMGTKSGAEVVGELHKRFPELPIFAASAMWNLERSGKAKSLGACEFPSKPYDFKKLSGLIAKHTQKRIEPPNLASIRKQLVGESTAFISVLRELALIVESQSGQLLILGENGTGKELLARAFHECGPNSKQPLIAINVAAIAETLIESELFGHEKGAFTDAIVLKEGAFERCKTGTLFLDEIGEASLDVQAKLLRAINERQFQRVGGTNSIKFQGRLVCATNRDLKQLETLGQFRKDLYYRISTHVIRAVPLRDRIGDIRILAKHFLTKHMRGNSVAIDSDAMQLLDEYSFPGNVRELENIIVHALTRCNNETIGVSDLPLEEMSQGASGLVTASESETQSRSYEDLLNQPYKEAMSQLEQEFGRFYLPLMLQKQRGRVLPAARAAGMDDKTFRKKWRECGLPSLNQ